MKGSAGSLRLMTKAYKYEIASLYSTNSLKWTHFSKLGTETFAKIGKCFQPSASARKDERKKRLCEEFSDEAVSTI